MYLLAIIFLATAMHSMTRGAGRLNLILQGPTFYHCRGQPSTSLAILERLHPLLDLAGAIAAHHQPRMPFSFAQIYSYVVAKR